MLRSEMEAFYQIKVRLTRPHISKQLHMSLRPLFRLRGTVTRPASNSRRHGGLSISLY